VYRGPWTVCPAGCPQPMRADAGLRWILSGLADKFQSVQEKHDEMDGTDGTDELVSGIPGFAAGRR
jgi:hypothetical protein